MLLIFVVGVMLFATMALLPPFLQNLLGYPVVTTGLVLAPRGVGTMIAMIVVGRLVGKVDTRALMLFGLALTGLLALADDELHDRDRHLRDRLYRRHPGRRRSASSSCR